MKATHGLVLYTGAMPIESTIDHTGHALQTVTDWHRCHPAPTP